MFEEGFPIYLQIELHTVLAHISTQTNHNVSVGTRRLCIRKRAFEMMEVSFNFRVECILGMMTVCMQV